jgi:hypothetical protein
VGVGAGEGEHPALLGDACRPRRLHRAADERRTLVHLEVGGAELLVGEGHRAVVRSGLGDLVGRPGLSEPGMGVRGRHLGKSGPQPAEPGAVLAERPSARTPKSVLQQGVGMDRQVDAPGGLLLGHRAAVRAESHRRWRGRSRLGGPVQVRSTRRPPGGVPRVRALGPDDDGHVQIPPGDGAGGVVEERLGHVPTHGGQHLLGRLDAQCLRHRQAGVGGLPREDAHRPHAAGASEEPVANRCRPAGRGPVGILGGRPQGLGHECQRVG